MAQSGNVLNINQSSQRAVINWNSFNVGSKATVNFNQPSATASTLNRVNSATPSMIDGAINANGQVAFVNANGVIFGKGAEINTGGIVATTMNIKDSDFMSGKMTYSGSETGQVTNKGHITATNINGYIALMAPEVKNEGVLLATLSGNNAIALVSGKQVTLSFNGNQLINITVDASAINSLIDNKRLIKTSGGQVIIAANSASDLKSSVLNNTGVISASSMTTQGGRVFLTAGTVNQNATVAANSATANAGQIVIAGQQVNLGSHSKTNASGATGGGQINLGNSADTTQPVAPNNNTNTNIVTLAAGSVVNASAKQNGNGGTVNIQSNTSATIAGLVKVQGGAVSGNGGAINIQSDTVTLNDSARIAANAKTQGHGGVININSRLQTTVAGSLEAMGGAVSGNGGSIETSSKGLLTIAPTTQINTRATQGRSGNWLMDPYNMVVDSATGAVISAALQNSNVSLVVSGNVCTGATCTENGSGNLTILANTVIQKTTSNPTTLSFTADGTFTNNGVIIGSALDVVINAKNINLSSGSKLSAHQLSMTASGTVSNYGQIAGLGETPLVSILSWVFNLFGGIAVNSSTGLGGTIRIQANTLTLANGSRLEANGVTDGGTILLDGDTGTIQVGGIIQTNGGTGRGGTISVTNAQDIHLQNATLQANGIDGGNVTLVANTGDVNIQTTLIQTNGATGRGGSIGISATQVVQIAGTEIEAIGFTQGGTIRIGNDAQNGTLPFSLVTSLDAYTSLNAAQSLSNPQNKDGGFIETSGHTLYTRASIKTGLGGMWLLDPADITISTTAVSYTHLTLPTILRV